MPFIPITTECFAELFQAHYLTERKLNNEMNEQHFVKNHLQELPLSIILDYLRKNHFNYLNKFLPEMEQNFMHIFQHFSDSHPNNVLMCNLFMCYKNHLVQHIQKEEDKLFPYIEQLIALEEKADNDILSLEYVKTIELLRQYSIDRFMEEHTDVEEELSGMRKLILKYSDKNDQPLPYRLFLNQLQEFENKLWRHAWLEDEVLLPKAEKLEKKLHKALLNSSFGMHQAVFIEDTINSYNA